MSEPVMGWVVCRPRAARRVALLAAALSLLAGVALSTPVLAASDTAAQPVFAIESPKAAKGLLAQSRCEHAAKDADPPRCPGRQGNRQQPAG